MAKFRWVGNDSQGKRVSGEMEASNIQEVKKNLRRQGIRAKKVAKPSLSELDLNEVAAEMGMGPGVGQKELFNFTRKMSILINAGVPIMESLEILFKQEPNRTFKKALRSIATEVSTGKTLHEAMSGKDGFTKLYCSLVKAGEAGGILDTILNKLSEFMEKSEKIKKQIKKAMTYPSIVFLVGIGVVAGLMVFVVPQFVAMLQGSNQEIPGITQLVMDISDFFVNYWHALFGGMFVAFIVLKRYIKTTNGKIQYDKFMMKMPLFGPVVIKGNLASFTRTLATLLSSGVPIIDALDICIDTLDNQIIARDFERVKAAVVEGETLAKPLARIRYFPEMVSQMVKVGEATGQLDNMLVKVSDVFEEEVDDAITTATSAIEPLIIVVLGGLIAGVMIAMYLPIFMAAGGAE